MAACCATPFEAIANEEVVSAFVPVIGGVCAMLPSPGAPIVEVAPAADPSCTTW